MSITMERSPLQFTPNMEDECLVGKTFSEYFINFVFSPYPFSSAYASQFLRHPKAVLVYKCPGLPEARSFLPPGSTGTLVVITAREVEWCTPTQSGKLSIEQKIQLQSDLYTIDCFTHMFGGNKAQADELYDDFFCITRHLPLWNERKQPDLDLVKDLLDEKRVAWWSEMEASANNQKLIEEEVGAATEEVLELDAVLKRASATDLYTASDKETDAVGAEIKPLFHSPSSSQLSYTTVNSKTALLHQKSASGSTTVKSTDEMESSLPAKPEPAASPDEDWGGFQKTAPLEPIDPSSTEEAPRHRQARPQKKKKKFSHIMEDCWIWCRINLLVCLPVQITEITDKPKEVTKEPEEITEKPRMVNGKEIRVLPTAQKDKSHIAAQPLPEAQMTMKSKEWKPVKYPVKLGDGEIEVTEEKCETVEVLPEQKVAEPVSQAKAWTPVPGQAI